ncbi:unnamed protein product [Meganyctiphanes norvegica]|uniref:C3H1-type domain-containing protein n=2 Tax=Meganyctiphanes norvegica TaxID=48144 RepID=A0AAV2SH80_MEGNR
MGETSNSKTAAMAQAETVEANSIFPMDDSKSNLELDQNSDESDEKIEICSFYLEGKCRFGESCFNFHPEGPMLPTQEKIKSNKKQGKKKPTEKPEITKKPPLKTAGDVRKRIQWDSDLPAEYFTVGYLDRIDGIVEKPFNAFTWEHLALVDIDDLAIPQHRIQYFKYKGTKVWDKNKRLDNVYGSAGNKYTITEIMKQVDEELRVKASTFDPDDDSDDEDMFVLDSGGGGRIAELSYEDHVKEKDRATHFLCIRVQNNDLARAVHNVQLKVIENDDSLRNCIMPTEILHITLAMVHCHSPESIIAVTSLMNELEPQLKRLVGEDLESNLERSITAKGLSTFGARVLYTQLDVPASFNIAARIIFESLQHLDDVTCTNHFDFVPHMTLLKVNRIATRERHSKYINSCLYSDYIHDEFGKIKFDNIHFCFIDDKRGDDGFYVTCKRINF